MSTNDTTGLPQSMRQRRILDVAREHPTASVEKLASMVSSATPQLVEDVLDEHGDPSVDDELSTDAGAGTDSGAEPLANGGTDMPSAESTETEDETERQDSDDSDSEASPDAYPTVDELSATQREVLEAIAATPEVTQREIAERFDVSTATINNRVNSIPGFEWSDRESFVDEVFDEPPSAGASTSQSSTDTGAMDESTDTESTQPPADDESAATEPTQTTDASVSGTDQADARVSTTTTDTDSTAAGEPQEAARTVDYQELTASISALRADIQQLSGRLSALEADGVDEPSAFEDAELVHKVAHACLTSDAVDEAEELRILEALLE